MVRAAVNPSFLPASCCSVEVMNGAAGLRRLCFFSTPCTHRAPTAPSSPSSASGARRCGSFAELNSTSRFRAPSAEASSVMLNCTSFSPSSRTSFAVNAVPSLSRSASMVQYSRFSNRSISSSRSTIMRSAGLCTRPADSPLRIFFHSSGDRLKPTR